MSTPFKTPAELRALLKSDLGLNASQVTVSGKRSVQYLTVTVRDPGVDLAAVERWAAPLHTWSMDNTDYCTGQSVHVETTKEVDAAHAAPWIATIEETITHLEQLPEGQGIGFDRIKPGLILWADHGEVWLELARERRCYRRRRDVLNRESWAIEALALDIARLLAKHTGEIPDHNEELDAEAFAPEPEPEPENIVPFNLAATPEPERPTYRDSRCYTQQSMLFAETDLFTLA